MLAKSSLRASLSFLLNRTIATSWQHQMKQLAIHSRSELNFAEIFFCSRFGTFNCLLHTNIPPTRSPHLMNFPLAGRPVNLLARSARHRAISETRQLRGKLRNSEENFPPLLCSSVSFGERRKRELNANKRRKNAEIFKKRFFVCRRPPTSSSAPPA
jgi:hypothetical protein